MSREKHARGLTYPLFCPEVSEQVVRRAPCSIQTRIIVLFSRVRGADGGILFSPDVEMIVLYAWLEYGFPGLTA
jgi:hypothetical protein